MVSIPVKVYYNTDADAMFRGYDHGDSLELVFDDVADLLYKPAAGFDRIFASVRETTFACLNGAYYIEQENVPLYYRMVLKYREGGIRSMSVGDVIVIGENAWACASMGWDTVTLKAHL